MGAFMTTDTPKLYGDIQPAKELLPSDRQKIEAEVAKEIDRELEAALKEKYRDEVRARERQRRGVAEPTENVTIDLPQYCDRITLDNVSYFQGRTYEVRASVAEVMRETMQSTWEHQSIIDGKSENFYRKSRDGQRIMTASGPVNTSQILRA
jgi:5'-deoxynucleotidase YfbR-like HD superfamily hydrolase